MTAALPLSDRVASLIASRRPGYSLPKAFYNDPEVFALDTARIFRKRWLPAGPAARIAEKGQWCLFEIATDSIVLARGYDGNVHAMHNVCRHRGSRVCYEDEGRNKGLVCPYHAWTYALDGSLLGAGAMPPGFDKSQFGLKRIPAKVVQGTVMVYLGEGEPPDISHIERDIGSVMDFFELDRARLAARMLWRIHANWKLVVENFAECYHCGPAHPEYCSVMEVALPGTTGAETHKQTFEETKKKWVEHARSLGHPVGYIRPSDEQIHNMDRLPIGGGRLSQSRDGRPVAPLMGRFKENDGGITAARIHPGCYWINACDHAVTFRFTPISASETIQEVAWLVHPDAVEGKDYNVDELVWLWKVTTDQDKLIIDQNQKGINSSAYEPGPYSEPEWATNLFVNWYLKQLEASPA